MADPLRPDSGIDPSALLDDWLASSGDGNATPAAEHGVTSDRATGEGLAEGPPVSPTSLLEALSLEEPPPAEETASNAASGTARPAQRLVLFAIAGSLYGVPDTFVTEVARVPSITSVPHVPHWVRGVTNLRGDIISVIDMRSFAGLEGASPHTGRLMVLRLPDEEFSAGLLVDAVDQIAGIASEDVRPPAAPLEGALAPFLTGITEIGSRLVAVLDLERFLRSADVRQFEDRREEASCEART